MQSLCQDELKNYFNDYWIDKLKNYKTILLDKEGKFYGKDDSNVIPLCKINNYDGNIKNLTFKKKNSEQGSEIFKDISTNKSYVYKGGKWGHYVEKTQKTKEII